MNKIIAFIALLIIYCLPAFSQYTNPVPTTPNAAGVTKAANFPVSLNTGVPQINVPLLNVDAGGGLTFPIELDYHAGGFKIHEQSATVGLGWSLSTDLQVTRNINGLDDFSPLGYTNNPKMQSYNPDNITLYPWSSTSAYRMTTGGEDGMPDQFNYKLLNKSGSFYYMKNSFGGFDAMPVPYDNIKIVYDHNQFIITDVDGTIYYFGRPLQPGGTIGDNPAAMGNELTGGRIDFAGTCSDCKVTTWKCVRIEASNQVNSIDFTYASAPIKNVLPVKDKIEYFNNSHPCYIAANPGIFFPGDLAGSRYSSVMNATNGLSYNLATPRYIEYRNGVPINLHMLYKESNSGTVLDKSFVYDGEFAHPAGNVSGISGLKLTNISFRGGNIEFSSTDKVDVIRIKNTRGELVKSVNFSYSYASPIYQVNAKTYDGQDYNGTVYLDSLEVTGSDLTSVESYRFLYKNKVPFGYHLKGCDAWGYRNSQTMEIAFSTASGQPGLIPAQDIVQNYFYKANPCTYYQPDQVFSVGFSGFDEYPNETSMQYGILKRIVFPTGGFTDFDFEANKYYDQIGIVDVPFVSKPLLLAGGLRIQKISSFDGKSGMTPSWQKYYVYGDLEAGDGILLNKPSIKYSNGNLEFGNYKYTQDIIYSNSPNIINIPASGIFPAMVIPCDNGACVTTLAVEQKTTLMSNSAADLYTGSPIYYTKVTEYQLDHGLESGKTVHEFYPPTAFIRPGVEFTLYDQVIAGTDIPFTHVNWHLGALKSVSDYIYAAGRYKMNHQNTFEYIRYERPLRPRVCYSFMHNLHVLNNSNVNCYIDGSYHNHQDPYALSSDFIFGDYSIPVGKLLMTRESETTINNNQSLTTSTQYLYENSTYLQPTKVVKIDSKGETHTTQLKYPYDFAETEVYADMVSRNMISPLIEKVEFKTDGTELSKVRNEYSKQNLAWGFDAPYSIQRSFNSNPLVTEVTMDKYDQYGNLLQVTEKEVIKSFLYGYDSKYVVAELTGVPFSSIPTSLTNNNILLNSPTSDAEMRSTLAPLRSIAGLNMIRTFTYKPQIGVTSMTDQRSRNTFYEYDSYGRLSIIKDNDGNIVKKNEYSPLRRTLDSYIPFYVNKPIMGTYNDAYCQNYYTDGLTAVGLFHRNQVIKSGVFIADDYTGADIAAEAAMENQTDINTPCATGYNYATIQLSCFMLSYLYSTVPAYIYLDLLQSGSVVATYKFPVDLSGLTKREIHLPPGDYQVSFRIDPSYRGYTMMYNFVTEPGREGGWIETGQNISLPASSTYNLEATNVFSF